MGKRIKALRGISKTFGEAPKDPTERFVGLFTHFLNNHKPTQEDRTSTNLTGKAKFSPEEQTMLSKAFKRMPPESQQKFVQSMQGKRQQ